MTKDPLHAARLPIEFLVVNSPLWKDAVALMGIKGRIDGGSLPTWIYLN